MKEKQKGRGMKGERVGAKFSWEYEETIRRRFLSLF